MAYYADLSSCTYFGDGHALVAIGWLERGNHFPIAARDPRVYQRLVELAVDPWQPMVAPGSLGCTLCEYEPEKLGAKNIFIPGHGFLYVCPELIGHYMNAHGYGPPEEFCEAVLRCPPMRSM